MNEVRSDEKDYTTEELGHIRHCLLTWKRIQEMPARPFWHLVLDDLDSVELAAAADRYEAAGSGHLAVMSLEKLVSRSERNSCINYDDAFRDLVAYHRETGRYDNAITHMRQYLDSPSNKPAAEVQLEKDQLIAELIELKQTTNSTSSMACLLDNEPTLTGRYLNVPHELAQKLLGPLAEQRVSRRGESIDWYDYLEEIHIHLNHRMCSWATPSSLLVTGETMFVEGLLWTTLTRPADVVQQELSDFTQAFAALRLRRAETIDTTIQQSYQAFAKMVSKTQETADIYRAIMERYRLGNYDTQRRPEDLVIEAGRLLDSSPLIARSLIAEAGARLLTGNQTNASHFLVTVPHGRQSELRALALTIRIAIRNNLIPLEPADQERQLWQAYTKGEVRLQSPLAVPDLKSIVAQAHPVRKQIQPKPQPSQQAAIATAGTSKPAKVGRNEPCPCGSGKKYKRCCGQ